MLGARRLQAARVASAGGIDAALNAGHSTGGLAQQQHRDGADQRIAGVASAACQRRSPSRDSSDTAKATPAAAPSARDQEILGLEILNDGIARRAEGAADADLTPALRHPVTGQPHDSERGDRQQRRANHPKITTKPLSSL